MAKTLSCILLVAILGVCMGENITETARVSNDIRYFLYTRVNNIPIEINTNEISNAIMSGLTTVVIVHGHGGSSRTSLNPLVKDELLIYENVNVIVVDWSVYARLSYSRADNYVREIAQDLSNLLISQYETFGGGVAPEKLHLVGFNLGAHIVGQTGRYLRSFGNSVARITALDPSKSSYRLQQSDAEYVEVIHTDTNCPLANGLGTQLGDLDFYPNGGNKQPGCFGFNTCDHNRAWEFFAASQGLNSFSARCCTSKTQMKLNTCRGTEIRMGGNDLLPKTGCESGILRVNTGRTYPFF
ncbi:pancreatic lipase-related protein 2-like [Galleria mellonella]|uniref:Pancreatic lipase-related protein 2-like n=1 Tax=Galleria mellonella TaxID=7137 RepID=A0A6J1WEC3_GALME|nr:pancreatic lipase-related protein 2-like [Galleria mellonella]